MFQMEPCLFRVLCMSIPFVVNKYSRKETFQFKTELFSGLQTQHNKEMSDVVLLTFFPGKRWAVKRMAGFIA